MNIQYGKNQDEAIVSGFEMPKSPDASYNNVYPEDKAAEDPPIVPQHLHDTLLNCPPGPDLPGSLPLPQNVILNHLYRDNTEPQQPVVALGVTHRFRAKYVTVVLYKPDSENGNTIS